MRLARRCGVALGLLPWLFCSCAVGSGHRYAYANMDFASLKSVAVMPFLNLTRDNLAGDRVRDVFQSMLLATGAMYVLPTGEVARGVSHAGIPAAHSPSVDEVIKIGGMLKVDAVITGVVKEYGEVHSGVSTANVISISVQMYETETGKVIRSASSTRGGISVIDWLLGSGGEPMNSVTEKVVDDVIGKLFK